MFIAKVYGIEFCGQTESEVYDLVYEYEDQLGIYGSDLQSFTVEWED